MVSWQRQFLKAAYYLILTAIPAFVAGLYLVGRWMPARAVLLYAAGRAPHCSFSQTLQAPGVTEAQIEAGERMRQSMRLVEQDAAGFERWQTARGMYWMPARSQAALYYDLGEQERRIYGQGDRGVHRGDIVLDCGANIGVFTREALARGASLVVAIEPAPENLACLRRNLAAETASGKVLIYPKGVWDRDEFLPMHVDPGNSAADSFIRNPQGGVPSGNLPLTTIDRLVSQLRLPRVDFIKMDIEGAEQRAIRGAHATVVRYRPRMAICVYHLPGDPEGVPRLVREDVPGYRVGCQCLLGESRVDAQVMYFY